MCTGSAAAAHTAPGIRLTSAGPPSNGPAPSSPANTLFERPRGPLFRRICWFHAAPGGSRRNLKAEVGGRSLTLNHCRLDQGRVSESGCYGYCHCRLACAPCRGAMANCKEKKLILSFFPPAPHLPLHRAMEPRLRSSWLPHTDISPAGASADMAMGQDTQAGRRACIHPTKIAPNPS